MIKSGLQTMALRKTTTSVRTYAIKHFPETDSNKVLVLDNPQKYILKEKRRTVHSFVYRIWGIYSLEQIGYLVIDIDRSYFSVVL